MLRIIEGNSRTPDKVIGDVHALVAGVNVIGRRLDELIERYGAGRARAIHAGVARRQRAPDARRAAPASRGHVPRELHHRRRRLRGGSALRGARRGDARRRRDRHRLRRHLAAVGRRDQRVVLADHVGGDLRGALPRRPEHPDERRLLPRGAHAAPTRDARQPEPAGRVRRARHQRDRGDRGDARRASRRRVPTRRSRRAR